MKYCNNCIQPDTRPNSKFTNDGLCPACNYFFQLKTVDWDERYKTLKQLIAQYRPINTDRKYDCIIGVSGGKDSTRQALWVRDKLQMKPLLVCLAYPPQQVTDRGCENISNLMEHGFDIVISGPSPIVWRDLMHVSFDKFCNWARSTELALFSCVPQIAIKYEIPLIFWGENPGLQLGDLKTLGKTGYDGNNLKHMNTLSGAGHDWLLEQGQSLEKIIPYIYPTENEFEINKIQIIYLGWFMGDWGLVKNGMYSAVNGLKIRTDDVSNTADLHGVTSLDEDWVIINQLIKYYKFGFGRVTDYCNEEIRLGRMTRNEAISLANKYDNACSKEYLNSFCNYLNISTEYFWEKVRLNLNKNLFYISDSGEFVKKFEVGYGIR